MHCYCLHVDYIHFNRSLHVKLSDPTCVQIFRPVPLTVFEILGFKLKNKNNDNDNNIIWGQLSPLPPPPLATPLHLFSRNVLTLVEKREVFYDLSVTKESEKLKVKLLETTSGALTRRFGGHGQRMRMQYKNFSKERS